MWDSNYKAFHATIRALEMDEQERTEARHVHSPPGATYSLVLEFLSSFFIRSHKLT